MNSRKGYRTKFLILLMSVTLLVCIILNNWMPALSQNTRLYVSIGDTLWDSKTEINALEKLNKGGQWTVFDLVEKQYLGEAKVTNNFKFDCLLAKDNQGSHLINDRQLPLRKKALSSKLLLVKSFFIVASKVEISQVIFAKLPTSLQSILNNRNKQYVGKEIFYMVDIDSDNLPDIVAISGEVMRDVGYINNRYRKEPYIEVFVNYNDEWVKKGRYSWLDICR